MDLHRSRKAKNEALEQGYRALSEDELRSFRQRVEELNQNLEREITPEEVLEAVMDGIDILSLIPLRDQAELSALDLETLQIGLEPEILSRGIEEARTVEIRSKPREFLRETGTLAHYDKTVRRLTESSRHGDPFHQFSMLTKNDTWPSKSSKYLAKSALNRAASGHLIDLVPGFLERVIRERSALSQDVSVAQEARQAFGRQHYSDLFERMSDREIGIHQLLDLARSAIYFTEFRPDIHALRSTEKFAEAVRNRTLPPPVAKKKQDSDDLLATEIGQQASMDLEFVTLGLPEVRHSKKKVLSKIHRFERAKREVEPDFDWRGAFWNAVRTDQYMNSAKKAALAALITTGCRPAALTGKGVDVHVMKSKQGDDKYQIVVRIPESKGSDLSYLGKDLSPVLRATNVDKEEIEKLRATEQVADFNTKGQHFVYFEIECGSPEALWLAQHVREEGFQRGNWSRDIEPDEEQAFQKYDREIEKSLTISWPHQFDDPESAARKSEPEQNNLKRKALDRVVKRISKKVLSGVGGMSAYVFRHAISSDTKAIEDDPGLRSAALGHASGRTAGRYGTSSQGRMDFRNRAIQIMGRQVHRAVRNIRTPPPLSMKPK